LATAQAYACDEETIEHLSSDGRIIVTDSGDIYEVRAGSTAGWSEGDTIQVCGSKIINTDENGESVRVNSR
jgi:hypothetical protein